MILILGGLLLIPALATVLVLSRVLRERRRKRK